jgi:hypothetical protein
MPSTKGITMPYQNHNETAVSTPRIHRGKSREGYVLSFDKGTASHDEIAMRYRAHRRAQMAYASKPSLPSIRISELDRLFTSRYGKHLPFDDAGIDDASIMAHHFGGLSNRKTTRLMVDWLAVRAPWMTEAAVISLLEQVNCFPARWKAGPLGDRLGLSPEERVRLAITTIRPAGMTTKQFGEWRKGRHTDQERDRQRANGAKPRDQYERWSMENAKPWRAEGISRRTWYRNRKSCNDAVAPIEEMLAGANNLAPITSSGTSACAPKALGAREIP